MTVSTEVNQAAYTGNGVTTVFPYPFRILNPSNLTVTRIDLQEVETVLMLGTDYTVTGAGSYNGGAVVLPQPLQSDYSLVIVRDLDIVQETDLRNQGTFFAEVHEDAFDYLTMIIQQVRSWLGLALRRPTIKSKFYDAKQFRIANLADPVNAQDAVNNRTMMSYVEKMIAGVVGGYGWFIQVGAGAVYRTFQDKMRDTVSVKDFNVKMDGVTDDTANLTLAFISGLKIEIPKPEPGKFILVTDTVLIGNGTTIIGPGVDVVSIKASSNFSNDKHVLCTSNYANGILTANTGIRITNLCVDANGYGRALADNDAISCAVVINATDSKLENVKAINSPRWNFFFTSGNPYAELGHAGVNTAPSERLYLSNLHSVDPIHGDGSILQGVWDSEVNNYTNTITSTLAATGLKKRTDGGLQVIEGCRKIDLKKLSFEHGNTITSGMIISGHDKKPAVSNIRVRGVRGYGLSTLIGIFNDTVTQPIGGTDWRSRNYYFDDCHLEYPILDTGSTVMQARLFDVQYGMDVKATNLSVNFKDSAGNYSSPTCVVNIASGIDVNIDDVRYENVPDVGTTSYPISRSRGWIMLNDANCKRVKISNVYLDNIGYLNRVISDTSSLVLEKVSGITVATVPSDGQSKVAIVCGSGKLKLDSVSIPSGMTVGSVSPQYTALGYNNTEVCTIEQKVFYGGVRIRSYNPSGIQSMPGLEFDRQYVSPETGTGKGSISFRTSNAAAGSFSITAHDEDAGTYVPMMVMAYQPASSVKKYLSPAVSGDTNLGNASSPWLNGFFVNAPQTVSDARLKKLVRKVTDPEISAGLEIAASIGFWEWNDNRGDREHAGQTVQEIISILEKYGLVPFNYAFVTYEKWDDKFETHYDHDEEGNKIEGSEFQVQIQTAGDVYGLKVQELALFLIKCISSKLTN